MMTPTAAAAAAAAATPYPAAPVGSLAPDVAVGGARSQASTFASIERMMLSHTSSCGMVAAAATAGDPAASAATCTAAMSAAASSRTRRHWSIDQAGNGVPGGLEHRRTAAARQPPQRTAHHPAATQATATASSPTSGAAIELVGAFNTRISDVWIDSVWIGIHAHGMANTITIFDMQLSNVHGPAGILVRTHTASLAH